MALTVTMTPVNPGYARTDVTGWYMVTVTNPDAVSKTLQSLFIYESTESDAIIGQPQWLTSNVPVGVGNPIIGANSAVTFPFQVVFISPSYPGPSPANPGGSFQLSGQPPDPVFTLIAVAGTAADGNVSSSLQVAVLTSVAPYPLPQGGALQFNAGGNLVNGLILGIV